MNNQNQNIGNQEILKKLSNISKEYSKSIFSISLKYHRLSKGLGQKELARLVNKPFQVIQKYENGKIKIPNEIILKILEIFNISFEEFTDTKE